MRDVDRFNRVRAALIEKAKDRELVNYGYFINNPCYGVVRGEGKPWMIGNVLYEICKHESQHRRPLLSAICVLKLNGKLTMPSSGFWEMDLMSDKVKRGTLSERRKYWENMRDSVFDFDWKA